MAELSRRAFLAAMAAALPLGLAACGNGGSVASGSGSGESAASAGASAQSASAAAASGAADAAAQVPGKHIIGVVVYDVSDNEVTMFRRYLVDYIAGVCFDDVQFVYSKSIVEEEELISFIDDVAAMGGEGVMSFYNIDLPAEVKRCADHGMYHIVASGTVSEEDFAAVEDNEYFLGAIGPMIQMEYNAGSKMVQNYIANKVGDRYFVMTGGAGMGNEMHYQRTLGMLDMFESSYGVDLGQTKELAASAEPVTISADELTVTLAPGYPSIDSMREGIVEAFGAGEYDLVLSTLAVEPVLGMLNDADMEIAQVDCYSQDNQLLFLSGKLGYLVGKYGSLVGPSFVAMYNAITGYAADFRQDGKAFKIVQNFWTSADEADFEEKFELASNMTTPAFNYEDLYSVCKLRNPQTTFEDFSALASAASFEEAKERRQSS